MIRKVALIMTIVAMLFGASNVYAVTSIENTLDYPNKENTLYKKRRK